MSTFRKLVAGACALTLLALAPAASPGNASQRTPLDAGASSKPAAEPERIAGEILVGFKRSVAEAERGKAVARVGATDRKRKRPETRRLSAFRTTRASAMRSRTSS